LRPKQKLRKQPRILIAPELIGWVINGCLVKAILIRKRQEKMNHMREIIFITTDIF
jgi:hypothetical protein